MSELYSVGTPRKIVARLRSACLSTFAKGNTDLTMMIAEFVITGKITITESVKE